MALILVFILIRLITITNHLTYSQNKNNPIIVKITHRNNPHQQQGLRRVLGALLIAMTSFGDGFEKGDLYDKVGWLCCGCCWRCC